MCCRINNPVQNSWYSRCYIHTYFVEKPIRLMLCMRIHTSLKCFQFRKLRHDFQSLQLVFVGCYLKTHDYTSQLLFGGTHRAPVISQRHTKFSNWVLHINPMKLSYLQSSFLVCQNSLVSPCPTEHWQMLWECFCMFLLWTLTFLLRSLK